MDLLHAFLVGMLAGLASRDLWVGVLRRLGLKPSMNNPQMRERKAPKLSAKMRRSLR